jgi:hypothetical protein
MRGYRSYQGREQVSKYTKKQNEEITAFGDAEYDTGFSDGVTTEQERILALLEEQRVELAAQGGMTEAITMGWAIDLIKGENK